MRLARGLHAAATAIPNQIHDQTSRQTLVNKLENALQGRLRRGNQARKKRKPTVSGRPVSADLNFRNEIVGDRLCDDTIKYLAPTLEKHKGCIVVDFNPGACLWSSKLHEFLQPKRHLLMEPDSRYFEPFIKPLLEKPHSTYRYTSLAGYDSVDLYKNYEIITNDHDLFPVESIASDDPRRQQFDPGVLFVGNLARPPLAGIPRRAGSLSTLSIMRFTGAMVSNQLIHKNGLARMLFWVPESDKSNLFAFAESSKTKLNMAVGLVSDMTEAVGVTPLVQTIPKLTDLRGPGLEEVEQQRVRTSMQRLQMQPTRDVLQNYAYPAEWDSKKFTPSTEQGDLTHLTKEDKNVPEDDLSVTHDVNEIRPPGQPSRRRRSVVISTRINTPVLAPDPKLFASPWDNPLTTKVKFLKYFADVQSRVKVLNTILSAMIVGSVTNAATVLQDTRIIKMARKVDFKQFHRIAEQAAIRNQSRMVRLRAMARWDTCLRVYKLEIFLQELMDRSVITPEFFNATRRTLVELAHEAEGVSKPMLTQYIGGTANRHKAIIDHQISFFSKPPGLPRDRRLYEPLKAVEDEFWPAGELMLLDFQPKEIDFLVSDLVSQAEQSTIISELLTQLLHATATPVGKAMDQIAPNMAEDLIPKCPSMSNPTKGGRFDATNMRVGMLTEAMIQELIVAFIEWPFRPTTMTLELEAQGSDSANRAEDVLGME